MQGQLRALKWKAWKLQRAVFGNPRHFPSTSRLRVLILSEANPISQSQIFPFHFYRSELFEKWRHSLREVWTCDFEAEPESAPGGADVVAVQTWFDLDAARCERLFAAIRIRNPNAKIVFLDSFAPTDLRLAKMLDPSIDLYVKKHVFRDRSRHLEPTFGDTNLVDHFSQRFGIRHSKVDHQVPAPFLKKLIVGPTFFTSPRMLSQCADRPSSASASPHFDVHARCAAGGSDWYASMRHEAIVAIEDLKGRTVLSQGGASHRHYMRELRRSRICFSPFGYGEVCWRDYEAVLSGALLLKPDMAHIETDPDIFLPFETYVPIAWDLSDLREKVDHFLSNETERLAITRRAYERLHRYARHAVFVNQMAPLFRQ